MAGEAKSLTDDVRVEALKDLRSTLEWLGEEVHHINNPVSPILEMTAITKALDGGKVLVADNVTDYPDARMISNLYATQERTAKLFGVDEYKDIKFKILDSLRNPIAPVEVSSADAPCQEMVIPVEEIGSIYQHLPIVQHTPEDGGRIFGSGQHFFGDFLASFQI